MLSMALARNAAIMPSSRGLACDVALGRIGRPNHPARQSLVGLNLSMRFINFYTFYIGAVSDTLVFPPRTSFWPRSASEQPRQPEIV